LCFDQRSGATRIEEDNRLLDRQAIEDHANIQVLTIRRLQRYLAPDGQPNLAEH
jgi:hypothetical protein